MQSCIHSYVQGVKKFRIQTLRVCGGGKMKPFCFVTYLTGSPFPRQGSLKSLMQDGFTEVVENIRKLHYLYSWHITGNIGECPATIQATIMVPAWRGPSTLCPWCQRIPNNVSLNHWIGRGGPEQWPPHSPDPTPMDFFIWGEMKCLVYETPIDTQKSWLPVWQKLQQLFMRHKSFSCRYQLCINLNGRNWIQSNHPASNPSRTTSEETENLSDIIT